MSSAVDVNLNAIWIAGVADVYVAGDSGTLLHYNGRRWDRVTDFPSTANLISISGTDSTDIYVLTSTNTVFHFDGTAWSEITPPGAPSLKGLWAPARGQLYAVGPSDTVLLRVDTTWQSMNVGTGYHYNAVHGSSATSVVVVGNVSAIARLDGTTWSVTTPYSSPKLYGVWVNSSTSAFAVGQLSTNPTNATILEFDGTTWSLPVPATDIVNMFGVWGSGPNDVFACGTNGKILHFDGDRWLAMPTSSAPELRGIAGVETDVFTVGTGGAIWRYTGP